MGKKLLGIIPSHLVTIVLEERITNDEGLGVVKRFVKICSRIYFSSKEEKTSRNEDKKSLGTFTSQLVTIASE